MGAPGQPDEPGRAEPPWWREPTWPQWRAFLAAWAGWVLDGFDFTIFLLAMPAIAREFGVTWVATAGSVTLTLLVRLAGGLAAGWAADRWGRRLPLMLSIVWFALCDGAVAMAPTFGWVLVLRTLFGFGMGAEWTSGATLAMESWPARSRGIASGVLQGSWAIGYILAALAYGAVAPVHGWRALFLVAALPALLVLPIRLWVPESPEWQARRAAPRAGPGGLPGDLPGELWAPGVLRRLAWATLLWGASFGIYYGLIGLWPALLATELGLPPDQVSRLVILFNLGMMGGAVAWGALAARRGVVPALLWPIAALLPILPLYLGAAPGALWLGAVLAGATGAGISGVTPLLLTSLFGPSVRARAVGLVYHGGALLAAGTPTLVAALAAGGARPLSTATGLVVAGAATLTLVFLFLRPRDALAGPPASTR